MSDINGAWPQSEREVRIYLTERAIELATGPNPQFHNRPLEDLINELMDVAYGPAKQVAQ